MKFGNTKGQTEKLKILWCLFHNMGRQTKYKTAIKKDQIENKKEQTKPKKKLVQIQKRSASKRRCKQMQ